MRSPLLEVDGRLAVVSFPTALHGRHVYETIELDDARAAVDLTRMGEVLALELFWTPSLPSPLPLPFVYDARHDTYDLFFLDATPASYAVRATAHEDFDTIYDAEDAPVGVRVCRASHRLPRCAL